MSKIQDLKGTHNKGTSMQFVPGVVSDVKDTRFERNPQLLFALHLFLKTRFMGNVKGKGWIAQLFSPYWSISPSAK